MDIMHSIYRTLIEDNRYRYLLEGLGNTLTIALFATILGTLIGLLVAVVKVNAYQNNKWRVGEWFCNLYINLIRGTPVVVQLMIMYYIICGSIRSISGVLVAIIAFGLNSGAYVAEIVRAGILAVDKGQTEAGRSLGLSNRETMRIIVLPQAIKNILPALGNEFITLLKETSVAGYITVMDLTKAGDIIRSRTYDAFVPLLVVAAIYLVLVLGLSYGLKLVERRLAKNDKR